MEGWTDGWGGKAWRRGGECDLPHHIDHHCNRGWVFEESLDRPLGLFVLGDGDLALVDEHLEASHVKVGREDGDALVEFVTRGQSRLDMPLREAECLEHAQEVPPHEAGAALGRLPRRVLDVEGLQARDEGVHHASDHVVRLDHRHAAARPQQPHRLAQDATRPPQMLQQEAHRHEVEGGRGQACPLRKAVPDRDPLVTREQHTRGAHLRRASARVGGEREGGGEGEGEGGRVSESAGACGRRTMPSSTSTHVMAESGSASANLSVDQPGPQPSSSSAAPLRSPWPRMCRSCARAGCS